MKFSSLKMNGIYEFVDQYFLYLAFVVVVIIVGFGGYYMVFPVWQDIQDVQLLNVKSTEDDLTRAQKLLSDLKVMREKYDRIQYEDVERLETVLPKGLDQEKLFLTLKEFGKQSGFDVTQIQITTGAVQTGGAVSRREEKSAAAAASQSNIQSASINLSVTGVDSYGSFKTFLSLIEQHVPLLDLSSVSYPISSTNLSVTLKTYYLSAATK